MPAPSFLAEMEVWRGQQEGLSTLILNPSLILGAGTWTRTSLAMVEQIAKGLPIVPAGATGIVDVRDVAQAAIIGLNDANLQNEKNHS